MFVQLTMNARDPAAQVRFWCLALGWTTTPPGEPDTPWWRHYRDRLGGDAAYDDRIFDPEGRRAPIWFQHAPDAVPHPTWHLDLYPTGRDDTVPREERVAAVEAKVAELLAAGASVTRRVDEPGSGDFWVTMTDPEGNTFCLS